ncbi:MAG: hypothetical protein HMLKMBBP_01577 [Planctomycetes bacterium]|nr:hypothetical protein [Planctomycetota bacterium]
MSANPPRNDPEGNDPRRSDRQDERKGGQSSTWLRYSHLGLQFAVTLLLCVFLGRWLDTKFGWAPWGTVVGSLFGITASMYAVVKDAGAIR